MRVLFLALLLLPSTLFGVIEVKVIGLICPSCAIGIKKHLLKTKKVGKTEFNTGKQTVYIHLLKDKALTDKEIHRAIERAGYEVAENGIKRKPEKK
tara:strand:- start:887 stop:1174 length:288 start_codon:yes stop_codon:yes gene_type:complete